MKPILVVYLIACGLSAVGLADDLSQFSVATTDDQGFLVHEVASPFQSGKTRLRVLMPNDHVSGNRYPVIYVLPVEPLGANRYGDGLLEIKNRELHNKHRAIFVAPEFSHLPWFADHPTDPTIRQERYFLEVVVPFVDRTYPTKAGGAGRLLLGFSKSGWGAWSLLLRHPTLFDKAAAWDAPLMMEQVGKFGSGIVFKTQANFEKYQITRLLREKPKALGERKRLILLGYGGFREDHQRMHTLLDELSIAHEFRDGSERKHDWHSGWVPEAVDLLMVE